MDDQKKEKSSGLTANGIKRWGFVFLAAGVFSRGVLQNGVLGVGHTDPQQLLEVMRSSSVMMICATTALVLEAAATCAVPIFAFLLVQGFIHTSDLAKYLFRMLGLAVITEVPYNLAMSGKWWDPSGRNPVFALALGLMVLYFYRRFQQQGIQKALLKLLVTAAAAGWCLMLRIDWGLCLLLILCVFWLFREKTLYRDFAGAAGAALCGMASPFFLAAPMGLLVVHFYNEEKGKGNRWAQYSVYPVLLLASGLVALSLNKTAAF